MNGSSDIQSDIIFPENSKTVKVLSRGPDGGAFLVHRKLLVIASIGLGWDHVSVSLKDRCPTWEEMCLAKDLFFKPESTVIQYHPKKSEYRNVHPYCLHMWKKQGHEFELPPTAMVG